MKFVKQFCVIIGISLLGEALHRLIPVSIPPSIYGLVCLFLALLTGLVKTEQIRETGSFLAGILPLLFVSPVVSLLECWDQLQPRTTQILLIVCLSTLLTFGFSGGIAQMLINRRKEKKDD